MPLSYEIFITPQIDQAPTVPIPTGETPQWQPLSTTLISGDRDAVLVDPPFTVNETAAVAQWFASKNKRLTHIFVTHGHGDHWFGAPALIAQFGGEVVASQGTIGEMAKSVALKPVLWERLFPGQIPPETPLTAKAATSIELEGETLRIIEAGHSDTDASTMLHVPSLGLLVAGDIVYNGAHQYLGEGTGNGLHEWLKALDIAESYNPRVIIAGHKVAGTDDDAARVIGATREYLQAAIALRETEKDAASYYAALRAKFPDHINPNAVWLSALALYK
ncbi:uncharacterized protein LOC62_05G006799 [Vanrija pseudolonga]|uniref:Metallo-beta-lactamase domain-containing protein n=1 Tax=Vanrija pseudolonga TaxID=143232 RepID=A0AAF0YB77_9TREE|nr:hypothetical protein LOC62_05G006799 [Vanrija pseudolonga]